MINAIVEKPARRARTQADADQIKSMLVEGKSHREVGEYFGASRNSIAGVCDRFDIRAETLTRRPNNHVRNPRAPIATPKTQRNAQTKNVANGDAKAHTELDARTTGDGVPLVDLSPRQCRWPVGEEAGGRTLFCGAASKPGGGSWCPHHHKLVYSPRSH